MFADKREEIDENDENVQILPQLARARITVQEDFSTTDPSTTGCSFPSWRAVTRGWSSLGQCLTNSGGPDANNGAAVLVEVKQVLHPICSSVRHVDITDTSITNVGLQQLCKKIHILNSLGEYSVSDSFLRSLCVVSSMKIDKFPLVTLHTRKVSYTGMYNLVHVFPLVRSLTCWEPLFDIADLAYLPHLKQVTLIRIRYSDAMLSSIIHYFENCKGAKNLEKVCLEFIVHEQSYPAVYIPEFDVSKIFHNCDKLKVFTIEFKDSLQATPSVGYSSYNIPRQVTRPCFQSLCHVQFGQMVQNSVISVVLQNCPQLINFHANNCPSLHDRDLAAALPIQESTLTTANIVRVLSLHLFIVDCFIICHFLQEELSISGKSSNFLLFQMFSGNETIVKFDPGSALFVPSAAPVFVYLRSTPPHYFLLQHYPRVLS